MNTGILETDRSLICYNLLYSECIFKVFLSRSSVEIAASRARENNYRSGMRDIPFKELRDIRGGECLR